MYNMPFGAMLEVSATHCLRFFRVERQISNKAIRRVDMFTNVNQPEALPSAEHRGCKARGC